MDDLYALVRDLVPAAPPPAPYYRYRGYGRYRPARYRGYPLARPRMLWIPLVALGAFFWAPFWSGAHVFFFPFLFFGGFWLFALWRRSLRF